MTRLVDVAVRRLSHALKRIADDCYTPALSSPEISAFLDDLSGRFSNDKHPFNSFVLDLSADALMNELIAQSLPNDKRDAIMALRTEHHELQRQKESEIAKQVFDYARDYRDRQDELAIALAELIEGVELRITPAVVGRAMVALGFDASLLPPQNDG